MAMHNQEQLHNQEPDMFIYTCNNCRSNLDTRYHCTVCDDFDLCASCYNKSGHIHKMLKLGFELGADSSTGDQKRITPQLARRLAIQRCIQSLEHACQCSDANCCRPICHNMKRIMLHEKDCKIKSNGSCRKCKQLFALNCYHSKNCKEAKCPVPFCLSIKQKIEQQKAQQAEIVRRRIATVQNRGMMDSDEVAKSLYMQRCIQNVEHERQCRDENCSLPDCRSLKQILLHAKQCEFFKNGGCPKCKQLIAPIDMNCFHSESRQEAAHPVPVCVDIKPKLEHQEAQEVIGEFQPCKIEKE